MTEEERELLKTGAEAALKPFAGLIERLFGGPVDQIGGMLEDSLRVRRQIRQIRLLKKLQAALEQAVIEPAPIPDKIWLPALQAALMEDDEGLHTMWANLLASAAIPDRQSLPYPALVEALRQLSSEEGKFLDLLYRQIEEDFRRFDGLPDEERTLRKHREIMNVGNSSVLIDKYYEANGSGMVSPRESDFEGELAIENVERLGIIEGPAIGQTRHLMTKFGWTLGVLCRHPELNVKADSAETS